MSDGLGRRRVVVQIVAGRRAITADTALRLARALRTSETFWLNLPTRHDFDVERDRLGDTLARDIEPLTAA